MARRVGFLLVSAALLAAAGVARGAQENELKITLAAEYTSGDYGTSSDTDIWYFPVTFSYASGRTILRVTVPYIEVTGTGNVVPAGGGHHVIGGPGAARETNSGLGDIIVAGSYNLAPESASRPLVDLTGEIKLGTADEDDRLGTGENDYAVQLDLAKTAGRTLYYGSVGYKVLGDPPGFDLKDFFYGSIGGEQRLDTRQSVGLTLYLAEKTVAGGPRAADLTAYLNTRFDPRATLQFYGLIGLADGSPDWGIGVALILRQ